MCCYFDAEWWEIINGRLQGNRGNKNLCPELLQQFKRVTVHFLEQHQMKNGSSVCNAANGRMWNVVKKIQIPLFARCVNKYERINCFYEILLHFLKKKIGWPFCPINFWGLFLRRSGKMKILDRKTLRKNLKKFTGVVKESTYPPDYSLCQKNYFGRC